MFTLLGMGHFTVQLVNSIDAHLCEVCQSAAEPQERGRAARRVVIFQEPFIKHNECDHQLRSLLRKQTWFVRKGHVILVSWLRFKDSKFRGC